MDRERRSLPARESALAVRAAAGGGPRIRGYAALFNSRSEDLGGFREIILPGAFDRALREGHDVRALVNHDPNLILGRTRAGTLSLSVDSTGLRMEITPPDTQAGRDAVTSIRRGDLSQSSFGFITRTDNWRHQDGETIRELVDLDLLDVSVVAYPAYPETSVSARHRARPPAGSLDLARLRLRLMTW